LENRVKQLEKEKDSTNTKSKGGFWDEFEVKIQIETPLSTFDGNLLFCTGANILTSN
jgi:hypothetical protein